MKKPLTIILLFICSVGFGQTSYIVIGKGGEVVIGKGGEVVMSEHYNPIAKSIFGRWMPNPTDSSKFAINEFIDTIDYYGIYEKADIYRIYDIHRQRTDHKILNH